MTNMNNVTHHTRSREAERLGEKLLPDMPFDDRLKVAEVALSNYGRVAETYPVDHERVRTDISRELRMLANAGERWAAQALLVYICKVCFDARAEMYEPWRRQRFLRLVMDLASGHEIAVDPETVALLASEPAARER